jgi:hypothetical protein
LKLRKDGVQVARLGGPEGYFLVRRRVESLVQRQLGVHFKDILKGRWRENGRRGWRIWGQGRERRKGKGGEEEGGGEGEKQRREGRRGGGRGEEKRGRAVEGQRRERDVRGRARGYVCTQAHKHTSTQDQ